MSEAATAALMGDNGGAGEDTGAAMDTGSANTGSQQASSWIDGLAPEDQAYIGNKGWESPVDMFQSYRNLEKFAGGSKNLVELPGADAEPEAMEQFFNKLGRPEDPTGYSYQQIEGADPEVDEWFRTTSHNLGLTDRQASQLYEAYNQLVEQKSQSMVENFAAQSEQDLRDLQKEWGRDYQKNLDQGQLAVRALGYGEEELSALEEKVGTAEMIKLFSRVGSRMGEDSFKTGEDTGGFGTSPAGARQEIENLKMDQQFMNAYLSGDKAAVNKMTQLMKKAYD